MKVEIIFCDSGKPQIREDVEDIYTKGRLICFQLEDGRIVKHPEGRIFSIVHMHEEHMATTQEEIRGPVDA